MLWPDIMEWCGAERADMHKLTKYGSFETEFTFLDELTRRIGRVQGDDREGHLFLQRVSIALQRGNAVSIFGSMGTLVGEGNPLMECS